MTTMQRMLLLLLIVLPTYAQEHANLSQGEIRDLLEQVMSNQHRIDSQLSEYTANSKQITRWYDKNGNVKDESIILSESYQSSRRNIEIILSKNGKSLSEGKIKKEREEAVKKLMEDEKSRTQTKPDSGSSGNPEFGLIYGLDKKRIVRLSTFEIFRSCEFFNSRGGQWNSREMILLDFRPRSDFQPREHQFNPLKYLAGTVWIDATDKVTARLMAFLATDQERKSPAYQLEARRMPDQNWLVIKSGFNASLNPAVFNGLNLEWVFERTNHRRFSAQVGDVKLDAPKPNP